MSLLRSIFNILLLPIIFFIFPTPGKLKLNLKFCLLSFAVTFILYYKITQNLWWCFLFFYLFWVSFLSTFSFLEDVESFRKKNNLKPF